MNWIVIAIIALVIIIAVCIVIKIILHRKLQNIDGFGGIYNQDQTEEGEIIIGHLGDKE